MCEATAYLMNEDGKEVVLLKDVDVLRPQGRRLYLRDIFGEQKEIEAVIQEISLLNHRILLRKRSASPKRKESV
ncbi:MAG: CooT family nickel-binding protein [candidate division NC10 bacterium]|nr:CooT family nickel-binding protein [candidate division NC10 bacterium]